jgi:3-(3-hydroxy-phenyl)propionate hydroxylase
MRDPGVSQLQRMPHGHLRLVPAAQWAGGANSASQLPVVIAGAGPTGLVAAILLAQYGVRSIILERRTHPYPLPRAVHLDDESCRILQSAGVADLFVQISRPGMGLRMLDGRHETMAEFSRSSAGLHGYPQANMFDQPELDALLRARAGEMAEIELRCGWQLTSLTTDRPSVTAMDEHGDLHQIAAAAVLGCDGSASTVRGLIGASLRDLHFRERWLVVDARARRQLGTTWDGVSQVCDPERAATYMQISEDRYRWEFRLRPGEPASALSTPQRLGALLQPWTGRDDLAGLEIMRSAEYTFRAQLSSRWRRDMVFLLGDAAHETPPFIGQGLGAGLRDAANLAWKLAMVITGQADDALLDSYQAERSPHAEALIKKAVLLGWAMTGGHDRAARIRQLGLFGLVRIPGVTTNLLDRGTPPLRPGELVPRGPLAGQMMPQPTVIAHGQQWRLDDLLGAGFSVVSLGALTPQLNRFSARLEAKVIVLQGYPADEDSIWEPGGVLARWLTRARAQAVLIRPDRVVLAATDRHGHLRGDGLRVVIRALRLLHPRSDGPQQG